MSGRSRPGPTSLPIGWRPRCARCRVDRHDRCVGPLDCGCEDESHVPPPPEIIEYDHPLTQEEYDAIVRRWEQAQTEALTQLAILPDTGMVMVPMMEVARRLTFDQWVEVGQLREWLNPTLDAVVPPEPVAEAADPEGTVEEESHPAADPTLPAPPPAS